MSEELKIGKLTIKRAPFREALYWIEHDNGTYTQATKEEIDQAVEKAFGELFEAKRLKMSLP